MWVSQCHHSVFTVAILDLHSAPGKQNGDSHSGINGHVGFFKKSNLNHTTKVLKLLATAVAETPNVIGIELVNEPKNDASLWNWYTSTLDTLRHTVGYDFAFYIGDAWDTYQYAALIEQREDFVVLDHHLYRCFTHEDQRLTGEQHASMLPPKHLTDYYHKTRGNLVVAEFSAALNPNSMRSSDAGEQDRQRRVFAHAELNAFSKICGGWWFWTYKKDGWDAGWSLRDTVRAEIMPKYVGIPRGDGRRNDMHKKDSDCESALTAHQSYWGQHKSSHGYEHWRFGMGFKQGWDDAFMFFNFRPSTVVEMPISELGFSGQWKKRRTHEHVSEKGNSKNVWEFGKFSHSASSSTLLNQIKNMVSSRATKPLRNSSSDNN